MAVPFDPNKKPDDQTADASNGQSSETVLSKENSTAGADAGPSSSPTGTSSGSFTNLQSYLSANADQGFGGQVAGKVQGDVDSAKAAQSDATNSFKGDVDKGSTKYDQGLVDKAVADPNAVANSQPDYDAFVKQRDASYGGPNSFESDTTAYDPAYQATSKATQAAGAADSEGGRYSLLDQYYGRPTYGNGQKSLDNLLIQNDPNSRAAFADTKKNAADAQSNFDTLGSQLSGYVDTAKQNTSDAASKTKAALFGEGGTGTNVTGGAIGGFNDNLTDKYNKALAANKTAYTQFGNDLRNGTLNDSELSKLGLTQGARLYNLPAALDSNRYLNQANDPTRNQVASQDDYARINALSKLGGVDNTFVPDASQVGTYDPSQAVNYNADMLAKDIAGGRSAYEDQLNRGRFAGTGTATLGAADGVSNPFAGGGNSLASQLAEESRLKQKQAEMDPMGGYASEAADKATASQLDQLLAQIQQQSGYNNVLGAPQAVKRVDPGPGVIGRPSASAPSFMIPGTAPAAAPAPVDPLDQYRHILG